MTPHAKFPARRRGDRIAKGLNVTLVVFSLASLAMMGMTTYEVWAKNVHNNPPASAAAK